MANRSVATTLSLVLILVSGLSYIVLSFHHSLRFANPAAEIPIMRGNKGIFHCYHSQIYRGGADFDVLVFGSSRTNVALEESYIYAAEQQLGKTPPSVFAFTTPWSNPEFAYFFLRDYLEHNQPPETILVELTPVKKLPGPVHYVHPFFVDIAPFDLYLDVLKSWDFVESPVFAASHFLRLLVRHVDLSLSRLLVRDKRITAKASDNCVSEPASMGETVGAPPATDYQSLLRKAVAAVTPEIPRDRIGQPDQLLEDFSENEKMQRFVKQYSASWLETGSNYRWDSSSTSDRSFDYYERIRQLAQEHDIAMAYYFMPDLLTPEDSLRKVEQLSARLGAPVFTLPYEYMLVSWHHYADGVHVAESFQKAYSIWFGSIIEKVEGD